MSTENIRINQGEVTMNTETNYIPEENLSAETSQPSTQEQIDSRIQDEDLKLIIERRVQEEVNQAKAAFKEKLDEVYSTRDEVLKQKVQLEEEKRQAEIKRMEDEGRHKEVAELKVAEMNARLESLQKENIRLTRDHAVKDALRGLDFRSDLAAEMAYERFVNQMVQDEANTWKHKSGISIKEYVSHFSKDDENSFLFKAKVNSGTGAATAAGTATPQQLDKPITEMTTEELLQHFSSQPQSNTFGF